MTRVKELPLNERPREKAMNYGFQCLSDQEVLAILIRNGGMGNSSLTIASMVIHKAKGLNKLPSLTMNELLQIKGIKKVKAIELLACFELVKRINYKECLNKDIFSSPDIIVQWLRCEIGYAMQEKFLVLFLNAKNHLLSYRLLFQGTVDCSVVHPREIFKEAILHSSSRIVLIHNHPSGDCTPSQADIDVTNQLMTIGQMMGIEVMDHLIVSDSSYFSFKQKGFL